MSTAFLKLWSDVEYVYRCLADRERTLAFQSAIKQIVKPGHTVLDLGTGSGIMALFAATAGASRVYTVEISDYLYKASREIFMENGFGDTIVSLHMDAREVTLAHVEKPDVVICEAITTGLIGEPQAPIINALKKTGVIDHQTMLVPAGLSTSVTLVSLDWKFYGIPLRFPLFVDYFTRAFEKSHQIRSETKVGHVADFSADFTGAVRVSERLRFLEDGYINGLMLTSTTDFIDRPKLEDCVSYCQPVILPIGDMQVTAGSAAEVTVQYQMGMGFDSLEYAVDLIA